MRLTDYEPTAGDVAWARALMAHIKEGGTVAMPGAAMIWLVSHKNKTLILVNHDRLHDQLGREVYLRTKATFAVIGYTVAPA